MSAHDGDIAECKSLRGNTVEPPKTLLSKSNRSPTKPLQQEAQGTSRKRRGRATPTLEGSPLTNSFNRKQNEHEGRPSTQAAPAVPAAPPRRPRPRYTCTSAVSSRRGHLFTAANSLLSPASSCVSTSAAQSANLRNQRVTG